MIVVLKPGIQPEVVTPMAFAGIAAGADGLSIEVRPKPEVVLSEVPPSLKPPKFAALMEQLKRLAVALGGEV